MQKEKYLYGYETVTEKEEIVMMKNLTLEHIAAACHGTYYGSEEKKSQCIEAVTTDSRKVEKGCLFVPIVGARADGL